MTPNIIFSGYDDRQSSGFNVFAHSVWRHSGGRVDVIPIRHKLLRDKGIFKRPWKVGETGQFVDLVDGKPFSTQFSHTRFLVPWLARQLGLKGMVAFMDGNDFLCLGDPTPLFHSLDYEDSYKPVHVVKHEYHVAENLKMDGMNNAAYPKKNWSSMMLFEVDHPSLDILEPGYVNTVDGGQMHQFKWLQEGEIGSLPSKWNHLVGETLSSTAPIMAHFTHGIPIHKGYEDGPLAWLWKNEYEASKNWTPTPSIKMENLNDYRY